MIQAEQQVRESVFWDIPQETLEKDTIRSRKPHPGKRFIDLFFSGIGMLAFLLIYPVVALGIKLSSPGPVIFKQQRTGQSGEPFTCYKFRTMHYVQRRTLNGIPDITYKGDPRIFWFGSVLRKLNMDEMPQLINVLKGDMSLVGPRPYPVKECAYWNAVFDDFYQRYSVKPGISGLAQVKGYRGGTLNEDLMRKRLDYDLLYIREKSLVLDLKIIGRTILQMIHLDTSGH